jgi:hypothetical protein
MKNHLTIFDPIFGVNIEAFKNIEEKKWYSWLQKKADGDIEFPDESTDGHREAGVIYVNPYTYSIAIFRDSKISLGMLAHEVSHLVWRILDIHGVKHCIETDELYGYYTEFLYKRLYEFYFSI